MKTSLKVVLVVSLSTEQRSATQRLMSEHKERARALGAGVVNAERELDSMFAQRAATPDAVDAATRRVALLQAELRSEHLKTHLAQTALLKPEPVRLYSVLRGYPEGGARLRNDADHYQK